MLIIKCFSTQLVSLSEFEVEYHRCFAKIDEWKVKKLNNKNRPTRLCKLRSIVNSDIEKLENNWYSLELWSLPIFSSIRSPKKWRLFIPRRSSGYLTSKIDRRNRHGMWNTHTPGSIITVNDLSMRKITYKWIDNSF